MAWERQNLNNAIPGEIVIPCKKTFSTKGNVILCKQPQNLAEKYPSFCKLYIRWSVHGFGSSFNRPGNIAYSKIFAD